jgi:hypothetical protein
MHRARAALRFLWGCGACCSLGISAATAAPIPLEVVLTADNTYALYYGTLSSADAFVASDGDWPTAETHTLTLPDSGYIYVAGYTDAFDAQGLLAQVTNTSTSERFYSGDPRWQVTCTGIYMNAAPSPSDLSTEIMKANAGTNPCGGWVSTTVGQQNLRARPWRTIEGVDNVARWMWYDSNQDDRMCAPFAGFNHNEYLIFRVLVEGPRILKNARERKKRR